MSLQKGKTHAAVLRFNGEDGIAELLKKAKQHAAVPFKSAGFYQETCGFAPGKILLADEITEENSVDGDILLLNIRRTAKKIDSGLLKAQIQKIEADYMKQFLMDFIPKNKHRKIKQEAIDLLATEKILTVKGIELAIAPGDNAVIIESATPGEIDLASALIAKDLGISCSSSCSDPDVRRRFFTWLFLRSREHATLLDGTTFFVDGPMELFATEKNDGSIEQMTKARVEGGMVTDSRELQLMFESNKLLKKAYVTIHSAAGIWKFSFDCDHFTYSALELPSEKSHDLRDRISAILELQCIMEKLYFLWKKEKSKEAGEENLPGLEEEG